MLYEVITANGAPASTITGVPAPPLNEPHDVIPAGEDKVDGFDE